MVVEYLDPRAERKQPPEPYTATLNVPLSEPGLHVGLLANGFPDSVAFLDEIEHQLAAALPTATFLRYAKPNPSVGADEHLLARIAAECATVVTAYGH